MWTLRLHFGSPFRFARCRSIAAYQSSLIHLIESSSWSSWKSGLTLLVTAHCAHAWRGILNLDKYTRFGYRFTCKMARVLERKDFARWQTREGLPDIALCMAVREMEAGLIDADLGGLL